MKLPGVYTEARDGGLGLLGNSGTGARAVVGVSSLGTPGQIYSFASADDVVAKLGKGPLVDALVDQLVLGGGMVYGVRVGSSIEGKIQAGADNPSPQVSLDGAYDSDVDITIHVVLDPDNATPIADPTVPVESFDVQVVITRAGVLGTARFHYSLDGGDTWSSEVVTSASYPIPNTLHTLTFSAGNYLIGQVYTWQITAPSASVGDIQAACRTLIGSNYSFEYIHVTQPTDKSGWILFDSLGLEAENQHRFMFFLADCLPPQTDDVDAWVNGLLQEKSTFASPRVVLNPMWGEVVDNVKGGYPTRNLTSRLGARLSKHNIAENPAWVRRGPVVGLDTPVPVVSGDWGKSSRYNNAHAQVLDENGFMALHQIKNRSGWFWVEGRTAAEVTSDFSLIMNVRVMNKARTLVRQALLDFVQEAIDPTDLNASLKHLLAIGRTPLQAMITDREITGARLEVPPGQNILSTRKLTIMVYLIPFGYLREIFLPFQFENPFLQAS